MGKGGGGGLARPARLERATFGFGGRHSIHLSYGRVADGIVTRLKSRFYPTFDPRYNLRLSPVATPGKSA
ncbi:MAG: hypothetical protein JWO70_1576 [Betaproteobacteria bacterium]|nr:hypothetical protein [Betaproteobacteria bacterium]